MNTQYVLNLPNHEILTKNRHKDKNNAHTNKANPIHAA